MFDDDDAVAIGVAFGFDHIDAVSNLLGFREIVVRTIGESDRNDIFDTL